MRALDTDLKQALEALVGAGHVRAQEPMAEHTSFRLGGPADLFVVPGSTSELTAALGMLRARDVPYFVLGKGSDLLVADAGVRLVVLSCSERMSALRREGSAVVAEAGCDLKRLSAFAADCGLSGLEFACGIPGSVGGAVFMNAGAYEGSISQVLSYADCLTADGTAVRFAASELDFGYRQSRVRKEGLVVLSAAFELAPADPAAVYARMEELTELREAKQPLEYASAGSTFKRPTGYFAGKLISDAGLKGYRHGGAQVSQKHAGFVINTGDATAADVRELIGIVQERVYERFGVMLEPEVQFLGF